jgi:hypothetical protein
MAIKAQLGLALASSCLLAIVGCAVGTGDDDVFEASLASTPVEAGAGDGENSIVLPPPSVQTTPDAGAADASPDAAKGDAGAPPDGGTTTVACTAPAACAGATDLGTVSGDETSNVLTADGTGSKWFRVWVTEDDDGVAGVKLRATATLTSPPGTNFDLYLYTGSSSGHECSAVASQSTNGSGTDSAEVSFGESGVLANGSNDSRYVTVEVRHVSGTCSASSKWSLAFAGN